MLKLISELNLFSQIVYDMLDEGKIEASEFDEELEKIKKKLE